MNASRLADQLDTSKEKRPRSAGLELTAALGLSGLILAHAAAAQLSWPAVYFMRSSQRDLLIGWLIVLAGMTAVCFGAIQLWKAAKFLRLPLNLLGVTATLYGVMNFEHAIGLEGKRLAAVLALSVLAATVGVIRIRRNGGSLRKMVWIYQGGAILAGVCVVSALWAIFHPYQNPKFDSPTVPDPKAPIVWVVFDELDQGWLFDHRPAGLNLPEFDAFRAHSVYFSNAKRPGPETLESLPALTLGRYVQEAHPSSPTELLVRYPGTKNSVSWGSQDNIFTGMRAQGLHSSLIGFYHNYAPVFGGTVSHVRCEGFVAYGIPSAIECQLLLLIPGGPRTALEEWLGDHDLWNQALVTEDRKRLDLQLTDTRTAIEQWRTGMIFLHICLPHAPWTEGHFDATHKGYLSNLTLTDRFLKEIRLSLQRMNEWDSSTVVITADHNFRQTIMGAPLNRKVPLLVKLPGQSGQTTCAQAIDSVNERWLLEAIAAGKVKTGSQAVQFMVDRTRPGGP